MLVDANSDEGDQDVDFEASAPTIKSTTDWSFWLVDNLQEFASRMLQDEIS